MAIAENSVAPDIQVTDTPGQAAYDTILTGIIAYNESQAGMPSGHRLLAVLVKDEDGKVLGGLWGATHWQWLFVHLLWLPDRLRGDGLGRELLRRGRGGGPRLQQCLARHLQLPGTRLLR